MITFSLFVEKVWFVAQVKEKEIRETTQVFYRYLMNKMCEYFGNKETFMKGIDYSYYEEE